MAIRQNAVRRPVRKPPPKVGLSRNGGKSEAVNRYHPGKKKTAGSRFKIPVFPWSRVGSAFGWLMTIVLGLLIFVGLGFALVQGYKYFTSSPYFALKTIELEGLYRLKSREILEIAGLHEGVNTLAVSIDEIERALARNPWVSEISVKRSLPDTFVIILKEREPRFWVMREGVVFYADIYGNPIAPVENEKFSSLPMLEIEEGASIYAGRLPDLVRSLGEADLPLDFIQISWLRLSASGTVDVLLENMTMRLSIGLEEWSDNLRRLGVVLNDLSKRGELRKIKEIKAGGGTVLVVSA